MAQEPIRYVLRPCDDKDVPVAHPGYKGIEPPPDVEPNGSGGLVDAVDIGPRPGRDAIDGIVVGTPIA
jgi:hypothetical protein